MTEPGTQPEPAYRARGVDGTIWMLEHAQDYVAVAVGVVLLLLAAVLIISGVAGFFTALGHGVPGAATALLDRALLVLILVEIVHTVVLSLRAHRLAAQPFIVVGLVAVIRRILFLTSGSGGTKVSTAELALLIAMVVAFVAGLIAVNHFEKQQEPGAPPRGPAGDGLASPRNGPSASHQA